MFGVHRPCESGDITGFFVMWPRYRRIAWLCGWGPLILSHHPAKFGVHRPCESGDITFLFVTWPWYRTVTWLCKWGPQILSHHPASFGDHRPYGSENNSVCNISNSNSISNAEVPMPRFTNGDNFASILYCYYSI